MQNEVSICNDSNTFTGRHYREYFLKALGKEVRSFACVRGHYREILQSRVFSLLCAVWFVSKEERNRLAHALNGNTVDIMFYGDSSCYAKADTKQNKVRSYKSDVSWILDGYNIDIIYKAGAKVADIVDLILNGPWCDTIVVSILGNDFMYWNTATQTNDVVTSYPDALDDDLRRLVYAVNSRCRKCSFLLFGEAARWNYPARYDQFAARARNVVAVTAGSDDCV